MRIALISDIHGNALALEAVLREIAREPVDAIWNLGDIFYGPLWPRRSWELLQPLNAVTIRGNQDRDLFEATPERVVANATLRFDLAELGRAPIDWLRALPATQLHGEVYACHGTPDSDLVYLLEDIASGDAQLRDDAAITALLGHRGERVVVCGHTHTPRALRLTDGRLVVNPGSVGLPAYDDDLPVAHRMQTRSPQARWALIERGERGERGWSAQLRATDYDFQAAAAQAERNGRADWAGWLRTGRASIPGHVAQSSSEP